MVWRNTKADQHRTSEEETVAEDVAAERKSVMCLQAVEGSYNRGIPVMFSASPVGPKRSYAHMLC